MEQTTVKTRVKKERICLKSCFSEHTAFEIGIDEAQSFEQAFAAAMRLFGLPFEPGIRTLEKTQEEERIARGLKKINTGLSEAEAVAERERLDKIKEDAENLPPTDINPFMPKP